MTYGLALGDRVRLSPAARVVAVAQRSGHRILRALPTPSAAGVYGFNGAPLTVRGDTGLRYWASPTAATCGTRAPPTSPATGSIRPGSAGTWRWAPGHRVTVDLGTAKPGQAISKVLVGLDRSGATGGYRGYFDDLRIG
jgi:alpha-L-fucosidase 2